MPRSRKNGTRPGHYFMTLQNWGETNANHACHLMYDGLIGATVLEPGRRNTPTWDEEGELGFRSQVRGIVVGTTAVS